MLFTTIGGGAVLLVAVGVWFAAMFYYDAQIENERLNYEQLIAAKDASLSAYEAKSKLGYVLATDKKAGQRIGQADVERIALPDFFAPGNVITNAEDVVGKVIKIGALRGTSITNEMVYAEGELDPSLRKEESQYIRLPLRVNAMDIVDIRIVFPNGEDYVVLSKKRLDDVDAFNQISYFTVNEAERQLLQSSLVDAYTNKAELYAIQYVEPEMQPGAIVTYSPNIDVMRVLRTNPNIVNRAKLLLFEEIRKGLDARLKIIPDDHKQRIGVNAPDGGAVSKRMGTQGAMPAPAPPEQTAAAPSPQPQQAQANSEQQVTEDHASSGDTGLLGG